MVRKGGFEPPRSCDRQPLKLVRLPVPPLPRGLICVCELHNTSQRLTTVGPLSETLKQYMAEAAARQQKTEMLARLYDGKLRLERRNGSDPIQWTVGLRCSCRSSVVLFSSSEKKMIAVGAVENCALCSFPSPLWARSLRPQGRQRQQRLRLGENVRTG